MLEEKKCWKRKNGGGENLRNKLNLDREKMEIYRTISHMIFTSQLYHMIFTSQFCHVITFFNVVITTSQDFFIFFFNLSHV